jgi:hypothetical protein
VYLSSFNSSLDSSEHANICGGIVIVGRIHTKRSHFHSAPGQISEASEEAAQTSEASEEEIGEICSFRDPAQRRSPIPAHPQQGQLQVQVTRGAEEVPIRYNRTISGIYVVDLEQRYPFGRFNISIASLSKPLLQQSFEIALGHNQTMFDQLLESTTWNFANTQRTLVNFTTKAAHGISTGMTDLETTARLLTKEIKHSSSYVEAQLRSATGFVGRQLNTGAGIVKNAPELAWFTVQEATAPIRRSPHLSQLRRRAIWARCQAEMVAGVSGGQEGGKESWACSKMRELSG